MGAKRVVQCEGIAAQLIPSTFDSQAGVGKAGEHDSILMRSLSAMTKW
jgi:hypothetical protein